MEYGDATEPDISLSSRWRPKLTVFLLHFTFVFIWVIISPALLQSTVKLFFCPTTALDSPVPRQTTMLASDVSFVEVVEEEELEL